MSPRTIFVELMYSENIKNRQLFAIILTATLGVNNRLLIKLSRSWDYRAHFKHIRLIHSGLFYARKVSTNQRTSFLVMGSIKGIVHIFRADIYHK